MKDKSLKLTFQENKWTVQLGNYNKGKFVFALKGELFSSTYKKRNPIA